MVFSRVSVHDAAQLGVHARAAGQRRKKMGLYGLFHAGGKGNGDPDGGLDLATTKMSN